MVINAKKAFINYDICNFLLTPYFNMKIEFEKLNFSPLLADNYQSKGINFLDLDISNKINI
jgi:hypothetical protein